MIGKKNSILSFLERHTRYYYLQNDIWLPPDYPLREFAAQLWKSRGYIRHMSFMNTASIKQFLVEKAPKHFYYSSARYDQPGIDDMEAKGWRSADIVFDIDADHLPGCEERVIKAQSLIDNETSFIEEKCIEEAALHTLTLLDVLVEEIGFARDSISIEFSGHRGFHVTVYLKDTDEEARAGQDFRRELVNYVQAIGLRDETIEPWRTLQGRKRRSLQPVPPLASMAGYRGRVARIAARMAPDDVKKVFTSSPVEASRLYVVNRGRVDEIIGVARKYASPVVDAQVTVDTRRLIRAPLSINGKTMLYVKPLSLRQLESFTMSEELSPFRGMDKLRVEVAIDIPSAIEVLGYRMRLRKGDRPRLPYPVALYLVAKGVAVPLEEGVSRQKP